ncbi:MAG: hypothetical protein WCK04_05200 [Actinomycetes bacterium]
MSTETHSLVHRDSPDEVGRRDRMGVVLLIVADIAFVGCLIFSYLYLRFLNVNGKWLPEEITASAAGPTWVINGVLVAGALVFAFGVHSLMKERSTVFKGCSLVALVAVVVAFLLQFHQLTTYNFPGADNGYFSSAYSSAIVTLAGANAFHLFLTMLITLGMVTRGWMGKYSTGTTWQPRIASYWWYWVAISAVIVGLVTTFLVETPFPPSMK